MLGGGNPVGGNPAGTGTGLNYVGNHAYAYSGTQSATNVPVTLLDFTIGAHYVKGIIQFYQPPNQGTDNMGFDVSINGEKVYGIEFVQGADSGRYNEMVVIIAPYDHIQITSNNFSGTSGREVGVNIVGRVYA
tara:strand:- start:177 stop:575 length:399 start_codon:yes stop_codon:yes gene_type:complete